MLEETKEQNKAFRLPNILAKGKKVEFRVDELETEIKQLTEKWYAPKSTIVGDKRRMITEPTSSGFKVRVTRVFGVNKNIPYDYYQAKVEDYGWWKEQEIALDRDNEEVQPKAINHIGHILEVKFKSVKEAANAAIDWLAHTEAKNKQIVA